VLPEAPDGKPYRGAGLVPVLVGEDPRISIELIHGEVLVRADADGLATLARLFADLAELAPIAHDFVHLYPDIELEPGSLPTTIGTLVVDDAALPGSHAESE